MQSSGDVAGDAAWQCGQIGGLESERGMARQMRVHGACVGGKELLQKRYRGACEWQCAVWVVCVMMMVMMGAAYFEMSRLLTLRLRVWLIPV